MPSKGRRRRGGEAAAHALGKVGINAPELIRGIPAEARGGAEFLEGGHLRRVLFGPGRHRTALPGGSGRPVPRLIRYLDSGHPNAVKNAVAPRQHREREPGPS